MTTPTEIEQAEETGFMRGVQFAIDVCHRRAIRGMDSTGDKVPQSVRNEASKCADQIAHEALFGEQPP